MSCKGICTRHRAQRPIDGVRYAAKQRRCQICEIFIKWDGLWCPCCLTANELVHTTNGVKEISSIKVGESVLGHDGKYHKVLKTFERDYKGQLYKIKVSGHAPIEMTDEHPVFVYNENTGTNNNGQQQIVLIKKASELKKGDMLVYPKVGVHGYEEKKVWSMESRPKGYPRVPQEFLDVKITPEVARLFGYYLSEGYNHKDREVSFSFNGEKDQHLIRDITNILTNLGYKVVQRPSKYSKNHDVTVYSSTLSRGLSGDFGKLAEGKHLPQWAFRLNEQNRKELFKGWFLGDGSKRILHGKQIGSGVNTISRRLAYDMRLLAASIGYLLPIMTEQARGIHKQSWKLSIANSIANELLDQNNELGDKRFIRTIDHGHFMTVPIAEITSEPFEGKVYNLHTESETFATAGFLVHNCGYRLRTKPRNTGYKQKVRDAMNKEKDSLENKKSNIQLSKEMMDDIASVDANVIEEPKTVVTINGDGTVTYQNTGETVTV